MTIKDILFGWMLQQIDRPYIWGGAGWPGYDCSGLVQEFYAILGIDPPGDQTAHDYYEHWMDKVESGRADKKSKVDITFGTLLFFAAPEASKVSHVAIAVNRFMMFEAGGGGSKCHTPDDAEEQNAKVRFRRINSRKDFLCAIRPYQFATAIMEGN